MRSLGIYFGLKKIGIVEADGKRIISSSSVSSVAETTAGAEPAASADAKAFGLIKDVLRKNLVEAKSAHLTIPGKDLVIRTFYMPVLPNNEMANAVRFEAKKYIPFKIEELVCDYYSIFDKTERKNLVLFAGIKKESVNRYISLLSQLGLKAESLEYSGFSMLRLLQAAGVREPETAALVNVDIAEDDEVNFLVMDNGFPLFDRDIALPDSAAASDAAKQAAEKLEKLKVELRLSLDYYGRKFPVKAIRKMIFIAPADMRQELEAFAKERSVVPVFIDARTLTDKPIAFSTCIFKAYSGALRKAVPLKIAMDLFSLSQKTAPAGQPTSLKSLGVPALNVNFKFIIFGVLILGLTFFWGHFRKSPIKEAMRTAIAMRPKVMSIGPEAGLAQIKAKRGEIDNKIRTVNTTVKDRAFVTPAVDALPRLIPQGMWLNNLVLRNDRGEFVFEISGFVFLGDNAQEIQAVNGFKTALSDDQNFGKLFPSIELERVNQQQYENKQVNAFRIVCRSARAKR